MDPVHKFFYKKQKEALSAKDIFDIAKKTCNVIKYEQIEDMKNVEDLFDNCNIELLSKIYPYDTNNCLLVYLTKPNFGHWIMLKRSIEVKRGSTGETRVPRIDFFDPYGDEIDEQLEYISKDFRKVSNQVKAHLSKLLSDSDYKVHYNNKPIQKMDNDIATCGRYAGLFMRYKINVEDFVDILKKKAKKYGLTTDELVTGVTEVMRHS